MRNPVLDFVLIVFSALIVAAVPAPMQINDALGRHLLLSHPIPGWTLADRKQHLTGSGVFDIEFDYESGLVREVRVVKSTGHESLDSNIVAGLKRWRAKKDAIHVLRLPITYMLSGGEV